MNAKEFMAANETDRRGPKHEGKKSASSNSSPAPCSASITVRRGFEGWGVQFHYGVQHFDVGPQNFGMEREAEWMASMFSNALANMHAGNEPS